MLNNIVIGRYYKISSIIHNINPCIKIVSLIIYIIMLFRINSIIQLAIASIFLLIIITLSKVPSSMYFRSVYGLRYLIVSLILINYISGIDNLLSIISITRISLIVLYSTVLSLTTTTDELMSSLEILFSPLKILHIQIKQMSFILVNAIKFIPIMIDNTNDYISSQYTNIPKDGSLVEKIDRIKTTFVPIFINSINNLDYIIASLELKQYDFDSEIKEKRKIIDKDILYFVFHIVILLIVGGGKWDI